jgi:hypothetical protein
VKAAMLAKEISGKRRIRRNVKKAAKETSA